ncbi:ThiF family adenylyltransferase [Herbiconiux sp. CPCC 203407]|uniref:ThiF family adenylyltransferase n=1 Tax=Herbiconiux oxytropis TaxID=2970915 RepID=A0AA42BUL2_9MICO|nr:ThiF family adenylyltransferase [Herbiconiux oxytropis]MCS5723708.1 ThiF family adenylyltransferase [Herbiconiux oxytropis]MCS5725479.1 ThiF family adenylyltransferase [Herbiconiux oxytropis]
MKSLDALEFSRNYGFWSEAEQQALLSSRVAIAGVGGVGFQVGSKLARMGVSNFSIADPEEFEPQNANRVPGASSRTYGRSKAEVFREEVKAINPDATVHVYRDGVTVENADEFLAGATLVFDESETTHPEIGTTIARGARALGIPNLLVVNVGFAATVTAFHPGSRFTFERFMGLPEGAPLDEIAASTVDFSRFLPYVPPYSDLRGLVAMTTEGPDGTRPSLPSIAPGVDLASALGTTQAFLHLTAAAGVANRRRRPIWAPRLAYLDAYTLRARVLRASRATHWRHVLAAALRDRTHRNPRAAYTHADIARRTPPAP